MFGLHELNLKIKLISKKQKWETRRLFIQAGCVFFLTTLVFFPVKNVLAAKNSSFPVISQQPQLSEIISSLQAKTPQGNYSKQDIEDAVAFASKATGVRREFLFGMLTVESNMGQNTGQCTYGEVENDANVAHSKGRLSVQAWENFQQRRDVMKGIASDLNYDYENLKVSCTPGRYVGTGGAMGIPQFMPDTWLEYKDRIAEVVGKQYPDPWDVRDGIVAMALKVSDVPGVTSHSSYAERNAAKMYLAGNTSSRYDWYANQIMYWAANYRTVEV